MKGGHPNSTGVLTAVLGRLALAFCLGLLFTLICFVLLQWSESFLPQDAVRLLTRIVWWPVALTCGAEPRDLLCALPGIVYGFLFHWLVAYGLLWCLKRPRPRGEFAARSPK
jgi:hypothetical protein